MSFHADSAFRTVAVIGVVYGAFAIGTLSFGGTGMQANAERILADLRAEVSSSGVKALLCRLVQPVVWLLVLPFVSVSAALTLAVVLVAVGVIF